MAKTKQKQRKEKKRKLKAKDKILQNRKSWRDELKVAKEEEKARRTNSKLKPYVKADHPMGSLINPTEDGEDVVNARLHMHQDELETLTQEINSSDEARNSLNEHFESQGIYDMKTKMEKLQEMSKLQAQDGRFKKKVDSKGMKGSAPVKFTPNE